MNTETRAWALKPTLSKGECQGKMWEPPIWGAAEGPQGAGGAAEAAVWGNLCMSVPDSPNCGISRK